MAALGDSITRAYAACGRGSDCAETSWATGTAEHLDSHAQRLGLDDPDSSHNLAVSGARVAGLASQVQAAVPVRPDYVTVLIGANDACATEEAGMTSVEEYTATFDAALDALVRALPEVRILVLSVPDLARLWEVGKVGPTSGGSGSPRLCAGPCWPTPPIPARRSQARRDRVRARLQAYNAAMAAACDRHVPRCRSDRSAVFDYRFDLDHLSTVDYFHPSRRGQATLAQVAWDSGYWP